MSQITNDAKKHLLVVRIPDTRGVTVSAYGKGNLKIGLRVDTYSRLPGHPTRPALGMEEMFLLDRASWLESKYACGPKGTCPGSTPECESICYAARPVAEDDAVYRMWDRNSQTEEVPPIPDDCTLLRLHVSGDFTSNKYIWAWVRRLQERPDVKAWAYTRSWRCPELLAMLETLRALPNIQLFASMDSSTEEMPPPDWRVAWIDGDNRLLGEGRNRTALAWHDEISFNLHSAYVCPEETGHRTNCVECGYCITGKKHDVVFLRHAGA